MSMPPKSRTSFAALAPKYARLAATLDKYARSVGTGAPTPRADIVELQLRTIASLRESAEATLAIAEALGDATCPRDVTCLHLGDWNRCNSCFEEQVGRYFEQAGKLLTAVMQITEPRSFVAAKSACGGGGTFHAFPQRAASFTEAQQRVFELLVTGLPNKLIAYEIGVSEATVKAHVSAVLRKLQVRSRAQAIALSSAFERNRSGDRAAAAE